jgi:glycosyltransferase involved in cell wall biosynthesis
MAARFLVFADKMFAGSESFIPRSYASFGKLEPVFIGHELRQPPPQGARSILLGEFHGALGETGFKQFGLVSSALRRRLEQEQPVLIHAHFSKGAAYALPLARALGVPLVVTYHGGDATKTANTRDSVLRVYNRRRSRIWGQAALILPVSEFIRGELAARGCPPEKMVVQFNGVDPQKFAPAEKQKLILFAGRWVEKKGIDTLIGALALLKDALAGWRVRLIGDGDLKPALLEKLAAAGVAAELPGWVSADAMPAEYAAAMIVCVPSRRAATGDAEGLPMVCIEAMLAGCAIVGTRHAGIPECVTDGVTGLLAAEGDATGLAERLRAMTADVARTQAMGGAGRARALKDFNLGVQSAKLEQLLLGVAKPAGIR